MCKPNISPRATPDYVLGACIVDSKSISMPRIQIVVSLLFIVMAYIQFFPVVDRLHAGGGRGQGVTLNSGTELILLGIGTGVAALAAGALTVDATYISPQVVITCSSFALWSLLTAIWSPNQLLTVGKSLEFCVVVFAAVLITRLVTTANRLPNSVATTLAKVFILSIVFLIIVNLIIWQTPIPIIHGEIYQSEVGVNVDNHRARATIAYAHPLFAGNFFALMIICILASNMSLVVKAAACPLVMLGIWMADARTALIVTPMVIILMLINRITTNSITLLINIVCLALVLLAVAIMSNQTDTEISTLDGRTELWQDVIRLIQDNWYTGIGYYASRFILMTPDRPWAENSHNSFLEVALGGGIIGVVICILFMGYALWVVWRTRDGLLLGILTYCMAIGNINVIIFSPSLEMFILLVALLSAAQLDSPLRIPTTTQDTDNHSGD